MEGETMRVQFEAWFVQAKVDIVFAGHCHAYERSVSITLDILLCFCFDFTFREFVRQNIKNNTTTIP